MPTGYTAAIQEGANFKQFATLCARAFGATIMQRDDSLDAPLQTVIEPSDYNQKALEVALEDKKKLLDLNNQQWIELLESEYKAELERYEKTRKEKAKVKLKYEAVLKSAEAWTPPTEEHKEIKNFMVKQIKDSIDWDCGDREKPAKQTLFEFKKKKFDDIEWSINYHTKEHDKEIERANSRTKWLTSFVNSL